MMLMKRRDFLKMGAAASAMASMYGCGAMGGKANGHVVVVGGGYGGATVAKYLRMWSEGGVHVTLIERNPTFISCPISNLVIGGTKTMEDITVSYENLKSKWGVRVVQDEVLAVDAAKRTVSLKSGASLNYDRLVLSPGSISCGMRSLASKGRMLKPKSCMPGKQVRRRLPCASSWNR